MCHWRTKMIFYAFWFINFHLVCFCYLKCSYLTCLKADYMWVCVTQASFMIRRSPGEKGAYGSREKLWDNARFNLQKIILCLVVWITILMLYDLDRRHHVLHFTLKSVTFTIFWLPWQPYKTWNVFWTSQKLIYFIFY